MPTSGEYSDRHVLTQHVRFDNCLFNSAIVLIVPKAKDLWKREKVPIAKRSLCISYCSRYKVRFTKFTPLLVSNSEPKSQLGKKR